MIVSFTDRNVDYGGHFSIRGTSPIHWAKILRALREESPWKGIGHANEYEEFHAWLKDTWQITVLNDPSGFFPEHIAGIDVEDSAYTMLLIRFPP